MTETTDWNSKTIAEFRANEGRVGGPFEGAPMVLVHHRGRKSGREYVNPLMYLPHDADDNIIYVFATKGGAPTQPRLVLQPHRRRRGQRRTRNRVLQGHRPRPDRRRTRPRLRRTSRPLPRLRRVRAANHWHPNHPRARAHARVGIDRPISLRRPQPFGGRCTDAYVTPLAVCDPRHLSCKPGGTLITGTAHPASWGTARSGASASLHAITWSISVLRACTW